MIRGNSEQRKQVRYSTEIIYIQDAEKVAEKTSGNAIGINCPNCGAAIRNLGQKHCEYCGSGVIEINVKSWFINRYELIP